MTTVTPNIMPGNCMYVILVTEVLVTMITIPHRGKNYTSVTLLQMLRRIRETMYVHSVVRSSLKVMHLDVT